MRRILPLLIVLAGALLVMALTAGAEPPASEAFERTWARTDQPVQEGQVARTWMWSPDAFTPGMSESYAEAPAGERLVQYFDKTRMEDNAWRTTEPPWDVTNGLLVVELISGRLQLGDDTFEEREPAMVNVAGDADDPDGPTYASFGGLLAPIGDRGQEIVTQRIDRAGTVSEDPSLADQDVALGFYDDVTGHNIAESFWAFMNSSGLIYEGGQYVEAQLFENAFFATGRPITEAYWADVRVAGTVRLVLMQCFERRCLTYTPGNPEGFVVEAGNVGQHYYAWRYEQAPSPDPDATATPTPPPGTMPTPDATPEPATEYRYLDQIVDWEDELWPRGGLTIDAGGDVYAIGLNTIHTFDADGAFLRQIGEGRGIGDGNFNIPMDVTTDSNGHVYVVDREHHRVQKFTKVGHYRMQWGEHGSGDGQFRLPTAITVDSQDQFYVADMGNRRVQVFSNDGQYLRQWGSQGDGNGQFQEPSGIAVGHYRVQGPLGSFDGELVFVTDRVRDDVQVFTRFGSYLGTWGSRGSEAGEFDQPVDVEVDSDGHVYVVDRDNDRVQKFQPGILVNSIGQPTLVTAQYLDEWGGTGNDDGEFDSLHGIGIAPDDRIYVAEGSPNNRIQVFDGQGTFLNRWSDTREVLRWPSGLDAGNGRIYIADTGQSRLAIFDSSHAFLTKTPTPLLPFDVAVDPEGFVLVTDPELDRVLKFNQDGEFVFDGSNASFDGLTGVAVDRDNNVYVVDRNNDRIVVLAIAGVTVEVVREWGSSGGGSGEFNQPWGIAIHQDRVYVTDRSNHRVQVFDRDGNYLNSWGSNGSGEGEFSGPSGIAVDEQGYVYVADTGNHRVQKFTPDGDFLAAFGGQGVGNGQFERPQGITVDPAGLVYVADTGNHRVQIFEPVE